MARCQTPDRGVPLTRRDLFATVPVALAAGSRGTIGPADRPRIAAIVTEYRHKSHAQGIVDRFLDGYGWEGQHYRPSVEIVSLYVDQRPAGDLSRERAQRHPGLKVYPTIAKALTRGGDRLAVDGVLIIGEHGKYPRNEKGQTLYPRYEFFQQTVEVFRRSGRSVPVFNDKHLSWNWEWAKSMVETARAMGFPFMAGLIASGHVAFAGGRPAVRRRGRRGRLCRLWRDRQLRLSRPGIAPVPGGATQGGRDRRQLGHGPARR